MWSGQAFPIARISEQGHKIKLGKCRAAAVRKGPVMQKEPIVLDSVTHLKEEHKGRAGICASHGGRYAAYYAAKCGIGAVILCDAGIGREQAGIAGLKLLADLGVPAATFSGRTARIGDGHDALTRGVLSFVNGPAAALGLAAGMGCGEALARLAASQPQPSPKPEELTEARVVVSPPGAKVRVVAMDSISLVAPEDEGHVIVTASHGAMLPTKAGEAVKYKAAAVVCNDADRGIDDAGISRLAALDKAGIAGGCVSAFSSRIGDGMSAWNHGFISAVNGTAERYGGRIGQSCQAFVEAMVAARLKQVGA